MFLVDAKQVPLDLCLIGTIFVSLDDCRWSRGFW
jgi:hypothetical protein